MLNKNQILVLQRLIHEKMADIEYQKELDYMAEHPEYNPYTEYLPMSKTSEYLNEIDNELFSLKQEIIMKEVE